MYCLNFFSFVVESFKNGTRWQPQTSNSTLTLHINVYRDGLITMYVNRDRLLTIDVNGDRLLTIMFRDRLLTIYVNRDMVL